MISRIRIGVALVVGGLLPGSWVSAESLAKGDPIVSDVGPCGGGSAIEDVLELLAGTFGASLKHEEQCSRYQREISTGVTFRPMLKLQQRPFWPMLGGRGSVMADTAVCLLRDLGRSPQARFELPAARASVLGMEISTRQTLGLLDFDPAGKRVTAYQSVRACAPIFGCLDAERQRFSLEPRTTVLPPGSPVKAGDFVISGAQAVELDAEQSRYALRGQLPSIPVVTPIGPVTVTPSFTYEAGLAVNGAPFGDPRFAWHPDVLTKGSLTRLDDPYGRDASVFITALSQTPGMPLDSRGWVSQAGLGSRDGTPQGKVWQRDPNDPRPVRADLNMGLARSVAEKTPTVHLGAGAAIEYRPPVLPDWLTLEVRVEPHFDTYHAAQLAILSREARFIDPDFKDSASQLFFTAANKAAGRFDLNGNVHLAIHLLLKDFEHDLPFHLTLAEGSDGHSTVAARALTRPIRGAPLDLVEGFSSKDIDEARFLEECFAQEPPTTSMDPPRYEPGDPSRLVPDRWPCNICVMAEGPDKDGKPMFIGQFWEVSDDPLGKTSQWRCHAGTRGCYDLCSLNPATGQFDQVMSSAVEVVGAKCSVPEVK